MKRLFPLFLDIDGRPCLVVGAGAVALRKIAALEECGARVTVVSPETAGRGFAESDVDGMALVVAATDDRAVNAKVSAACRQRGIPVNVVDDPELCTFQFPAVFRKGAIAAAVSSGGGCPVAAQMVRDAVSRVVTDGFASAARDLSARRAELKREFPDAKERKAYCERILSKWIDRGD